MWASFSLRSGQLRTYLLSEDGRDVTLYRLFGGEVCILSASCVMDAVNIDLYIDAEEDTEALCISAGIFRQLMQENVYVRCYAYQMTAERFSDTMWTMQQILFMSADRRLAIFLTDELAKTGGTDLRMTHDQMAKYMGSAREVVSRMLKYFAQEGWVRLYRGGRMPARQAKAASAGKGRIRVINNTGASEDAPVLFSLSSGNGIHVPLHADGIGAVQFDVQRTGVVHHLLRGAGTAQHMQPGDHAGGQGDDQLRHGAVVFLGQVAPLCQQFQRLCPAGGLEAGVRVAGAALRVGGVHGHLAGQQSLLQRGVGLYRDAQLLAGGQQLLFNAAGQQAVLFLNDVQLAVLAVAPDDIGGDVGSTDGADLPCSFSFIMASMVSSSG